MSASEKDPLLDALEKESGEAEAKAEVTETPADPEREKAFDEFKKKLKEHRMMDARLKEIRMGIRELDKEYEKTENVSALDNNRM